MNDARDEAMNNDQMLELTKVITQQGVKLDMLSQSMAKVEERLTKLESLREQDIKQNEKIEQILLRLNQGNNHFEKIETRLVKLEQAEGKRAKELVKQVISVIIATGIGGLIGNLSAILAK